MTEIGIRAKMLVKDVMSSPTITINEKASAQKTAQLMEKYKVGGVIVTDKQGKPLGIITERDLITRVLAKNSSPSKLTAKQVMTAPLITVNPDETLSETARRMSRLDIRRLGVMYKGSLVGVITSRDILAVTPELLAIIQEQARIQGEAALEEASEYPGPDMAGYCNQCERWSNALEEVEGSFICEECKAELEEKF
ncbi:MAG: CBS domain-containing protein [Candidatus Bathyarchaeota archaeon]|nr:MAG: CBS domain-containing protein [Candidatus Bathyarchaeota archaeon]